MTCMVAAPFSTNVLSFYWLNKIYHDNEELRLNNIQVSKRIYNNDKKIKVPTRTWFRHDWQKVLEVLCIQAQSD